MGQRHSNEMSKVSCANLSYYNKDNNTLLEIQADYSLKICHIEKDVTNIIIM